MTPHLTQPSTDGFPQRRKPLDTTQASLASAALLCDQAARALTEYATTAPEVTRPIERQFNGTTSDVPTDLQTLTEIAVRIGTLGDQIRGYANGFADHLRRNGE